MLPEKASKAIKSTKKQHIEKRNLLSSFFITLLIALAYQEMIAPVRESLHTSGIKLETLLIMTIFLLTTMRFFVGNQLHLLSESLLKMPGLVWFYDLMAIIIQSVVLTFLGGESSVEANRQTPVNFVQLLIFAVHNRCCLDSVTVDFRKTNPILAQGIYSMGMGYSEFSVSDLHGSAWYSCQGCFLESGHY